MSMRSSVLDESQSDLRILPSTHSSATWCIMVNVSMWCLPTTVHKEWSVSIIYSVVMCIHYKF